MNRWAPVDVNWTGRLGPRGLVGTLNLTPRFIVDPYFFALKRKSP